MAKHPISIFSSYGELNIDDIPDSVLSNFAPLFDEASQHLSRTLFSLNEIKSTNFSDYNEQGKARLIRDKLIEDRQRLHETLRRHLALYNANRDRITEKINSYSAPTLSDNPSEQITKSMKMAEIRQLLRAKSYSERREMIENSLQNGDPSFLIACCDSPDALIHPDTLAGYRERWAYSVDSDLRNYVERTEAMAKLTRELCAKINATQLKILNSEHIDDPLPRGEHFLTFPPTNEREELLAKNMIQAEISEHRKQEMYQEFEKKNNNIDH
jgi:hypothetical protein